MAWLAEDFASAGAIHPGHPIPHLEFHDKAAGGLAKNKRTRGKVRPPGACSFQFADPIPGFAVNLLKPSRSYHPGPTQ